MDQFIIAHDVGTSGNKAVLVSPDGRIHGRCSAPFQVHYPGTCMAEQEPADWWRAVVETTRGLLQQTGVTPDRILCVTHCTQLLGILPMSAKTGAMGLGAVGHARPSGAFVAEEIPCGHVASMLLGRRCQLRRRRQPRKPTGLALLVDPRHHLALQRRRVRRL